MSSAPVVYCAVPTLFSGDGEVDLDANRALYKVLTGLLDGLFIAGTTGEFPALDDAERLSLIELALAEAATALGAAQLAAITPYYLPARPDELAAHYGRIREAVPGVPLYAYIFPERTGLRVSPDVFAALASAADLAGAKLSGSAAAELAGYVAAAPGRRLFSGDDSNPAATRRAGGAGVISGRSSAYPEVYAALTASLTAGDDDAAAAHQAVLDRIVGLGASIGRLKHALALRGRGGTMARMTVDPPDAELSAAIAAEIAALLSAFVLFLLLLPGCEPSVRVARHLCRGPAKAGRRTSN